MGKIHRFAMQKGIFLRLLGVDYGPLEQKDIKRVFLS